MKEAMLDSEVISGDASSHFDRWLHRGYFRFAGLKHEVLRRVRPAGVALFFVFVVAGCVSLGHQMATAFLLVTFCFGMFLVSLPLVFWRRAELEAKRELPRFATAGEPVHFGVRVRNVGKHRLTRAWLAETPPDPRPDFNDFHLLKEPGEDERNAFDRKFAYFRWTWLLLRNRLFTGGSSEDMLSLASGEEQMVSISLVPLRRGIVRMDELRVLLPDLFGILQGCKRVPAPPATLVVLPKRYALPSFELPGGATFRITGEATSNSIGNSGEFVGLRDYRPGDPLRQIHWKSWARTGRPIVKELENTFYPRYALVVDTFSGGSSDVSFEETVSVAASFAASIDTRDTLLDLMFLKSEAHCVTVGRGVERAEKLLEVLAGVTPERKSNYDSLAELVLGHRDDLTSCLVILNGWDDERAEFLKKLRRHGVVCAPIIVGVGKEPAGVPGVWLECGEIPRDLQRISGRLSGSA